MTEKQELLEEAKALGLSFAKNAKLENIKKSIALAKAEKAASDAIVEAGGTPAEDNSKEDEIRAKLEEEFKKKLEEEKSKMMANMELNLARKGEEASTGIITIGQAKLKARKDAMKMKRIIVTTKDPSKANWDGEIITVSNDVVGDIKKYIPFNLDSGYYAPQIIINMLKDRECTIFVNKKGSDGKYVQTAKTIKAHSVEILPDLTEEELNELAAEQAARHSID